MPECLWQVLYQGTYDRRNARASSSVSKVPGYATHSVNACGYASFRRVRFQMGSRYTRPEVRIAWDPELIVFATMDGEAIAVHGHPPAVTTYVSDCVLQGRPRKEGKSQDRGEVSPMSWDIPHDHT